MKATFDYNPRMPYVEGCLDCERYEREFNKPRRERSILFFRKQLTPAIEEKLNREELSALTRLKEHEATAH